jgi:hypothetical protein
MTDAGGINSCVIWTINETSKGNKELNRFDFLMTLGKSLVTPFMQQSLSVPQMKSSVVNNIRNVLRIQEKTRQTEKNKGRSSAKQGRCKLCPAKLDKKYSVFCHKCGKFVCIDHRNIACATCNDH